MAVSEYLLVRTLHVLTASLLTGGTALLWLAFRVDDVAVALLTWFEGFFWAGAGLIVFTGLGNLVAFGVPGPGTTRGAALSIKLGVIFALVVGSLVRTFAVARYGRADVQAVNEDDDWLRQLYAATGWGLAAIIVLAGVLARGL
ncbi:DUF2214 domain-containing protein [Halobiforma lacisalsi AJ5]|uniref:DUF2214 domain-containing protein n=2 Tax=Natronobacterium TaxID=2256 RepID=M0LGA5_NATLA|nr:MULTISPECIES: DUF2214 family protein [Halobiforma]APW98695.1 DUF2214 domain-containing protein [Halobiforma lacisalsi AJ5]EMA32566.1 hypothetical protein C445_10632 [Halobiforma lacisalsi AJ5]SFC34431.1 Predicted membrane protein [Halobiforma haloterrestris]